MSAPTALVTHADTAVGAQVVRRLVADGLNVSFTSPDAQRGRALAEETGASAIIADAEDRRAADRAVARIAGERGRVDVLVTTPTVAPGPEARPLTDALLRHTVATITTAAFRYGRAAFGVMRRQRSGAMVFIGGTAGLRGDPTRPALSVSLAGVTVLAQLFATEGAQYGVRAYSLCPDWTALEENGKVNPAALANVVRWLISDDAGVASGATLSADAARTIAIGAPTAPVRDDRDARSR